MNLRCKAMVKILTKSQVCFHCKHGGVQLGAAVLETAHIYYHLISSYFKRRRQPGAHFLTWVLLRLHLLHEHLPNASGRGSQK